jgi:hypothetical protein
MNKRFLHLLPILLIVHDGLCQDSDQAGAIRKTMLAIDSLVVQIETGTYKELHVQGRSRAGRFFEGMAYRDLSTKEAKKFKIVFASSGQEIVLYCSRQRLLKINEGTDQYYEIVGHYYGKTYPSPLTDKVLDRILDYEDMLGDMFLLLR